MQWELCDMALNAALCMVSILTCVSLWVLIAGAMTHCPRPHKVFVWSVAIAVLFAGGWASLYDVIHTSPLSVGGRVRTLAGVLAVAGVGLYALRLQFVYWREGHLSRQRRKIMDSLSVNYRGNGVHGHAAALR